MSVQCPACGQPTDLMTVAQVARVLGVSEVTVRKLARMGRFDGATNLPRLTPGSGKKPTWRIPSASVVRLLDEDGQYVPRGPDYHPDPV